MSRPRILLLGATGRTGNAVAHALVTRDDVSLAAVVAPSVASSPSRALPGDVPAFSQLSEALEADVAVDVVVDLTHAEPAIQHLELALRAELPVVLGATGVDQARLDTFGERFAAAGIGLFVVPNFSIGAVLGMRVAAQLARYFPDVEIVETHHDGKRDSPSGTAVHTAQLMAAAQRDAGVPVQPARAGAGTDAARGELVDGIPVHALRIPGATAHQEVVFGSPGEVLTIRHDAIDRSCYAAGVALAVRHVNDFHGLTTGLEHVL